MRIDSHQHFWQYDPNLYAWIDDSMAELRENFLPDSLAPLITSAGLDGSIAVQARQSLEETRWLLELSDRSDFILGVVGWVDLCSSNVRKQLEEFADHPKFVGVRHVVQDEPDVMFMLHDDFMNGIALLSDYNLTYDILIFPKQLPAAIALVNHFPKQPFVVDHIAKPLIKEGLIESWKSDLLRLAEFPNVFCKVSGMVTEADHAAWRAEDFNPYLDVVFEAFGPGRIMFGSDWPVCTLAASYERVLQIVKEYAASLSEEDQNRIFGENAVQFYQLNLRR